MNVRLKKAIAGILLLFLSLVVISDSKFHFHRGFFKGKREFYHAQHHWDIGYSPVYVYEDSPYRYQSDFEAIAKIIDPGYVILSDKATSYYAAATLPVYVLNVNMHHKRGSIRAKKWNKVLNRLNFCYLEDKFHRKAALRFLHEDGVMAKKNKLPALRYFLLNKDKLNTNLRKECLTLRSKEIALGILEIGNLLYEGENLNLYELPWEIFRKN